MLVFLAVGSSSNSSSKYIFRHGTVFVFFLVSIRKEQAFLCEGFVSFVPLCPSFSPTRYLFSVFLVDQVLHGSDQDVLWLQRDLGLYIVNLFDTGQVRMIFIARPTSNTGDRMRQPPRSNFQADFSRQWGKCIRREMHACMRISR